MWNVFIKVPLERIAVIVGKKGEVKKNLEKLLKVGINIDSKEGLITINGDDAINIYICRNIIRAVARGFNPKIAELLIKPEYSYEEVRIRDYTRNRKSYPRLRGRIIGEKGKARKNIEMLTGTYVVVYGNTIGVIGEVEKAILAKQAIENLLRGKPHSATYKFLENNTKNGNSTRSSKKAKRNISS